MSAALLDGCTTSADKITAAGGELVQFWRVLAGCVAPNGAADGRRVDLLGCRVVEAPLEGAALLKVDTMLDIILDITSVCGVALACVVEQVKVGRYEIKTPVFIK
jgi:hypothetical protein